MSRDPARELRRLVDLDAELVTEAISHQLMLERASGRLDMLTFLLFAAVMLGVAGHPIGRGFLVALIVVDLAVFAWVLFLRWAGRRWIGGISS